MDAAAKNAWLDARADERARLLRLALVMGLLLLLLTGLLLAARRMCGALAASPPLAALATVGVLLAAAALGFRRAVSDLVEASGARWLLMALPSATILMWLAALSLPDASAVGLALLYAPPLLVEGWSWGRLAQPEPSARALEGAVTPGAKLAATPDSAAARIATEASSPLDVLPCETEDESTLQQQTRRRDETHGEVVSGWVRTGFAAGQRHAIAHVAICPPPELNPTCYAEPIDGPEASVKVTQAMRFGVRLEVKLTETPDQPTSVVVEYSILEHPDD